MLFRSFGTFNVLLIEISFAVSFTMPFLKGFGLLLRRSLGSHFAVKRISSSTWLSFWRSIAPIDNGHPLIRIGSQNDGGYLVPDDLNGISMCLSPGVSNIMDFEIQLLAEYNIPSILIDASVKEPELPSERMQFRSSFVGPFELENFITIELLCKELLERNFKPLYMLQMDIEGFEYSTLLATSLDTLMNFRISILEFHNLEEWVNEGFFESVIRPLFSALMEKFDVVHVHPNNCDGTFSFHGRQYPRALEITLHSKGRKISNSGYRELPHPLDANNSPVLPGISLRFD